MTADNASFKFHSYFHLEYDFKLNIFLFQIARRLIHMGERINETLDQDFHERFKAELSHYSLFSLGYEQFRHVCISSLARVQSRVRNGWQQAYLLTSGGCGFGCGFHGERELSKLPGH